MTRRKTDKSAGQRAQISKEAARLLATGGTHRINFLQAKKNAVQHLGLASTASLPTNQQVQDELQAYQQLFMSDSQPAALAKLRQIAYRAMQFLSDYSPRLVGPLLDGSANENAEINLHVFSNTVEELGNFLNENSIPATLTQRPLNLGEERIVQQPEYHFIGEDSPIALTVFSHDQHRRIPLSPIDGRRMQRASISELETLLEDSAGTSGQ